MANTTDSRDYLIGVGFDIDDGMSSKQIQRVTSLLQSLENNLDLTADEMREFGTTFSNIFRDEGTTRTLTQLTQQILTFQNAFSLLGKDVPKYAGGGLDKYLTDMVSGLQDASRAIGASIDNINNSLTKIDISRSIGDSLSQMASIDANGIKSGYKTQEADTGNRQARQEIIRLMTEEASLQTRINEAVARGRTEEEATLRTRQEIVSSRLSMANAGIDTENDKEIQSLKETLAFQVEVANSKRADAANDRQESQARVEARRQETEALRAAMSLMREINSLEQKERSATNAGNEQEAIAYKERLIELQTRLNSLYANNEGLVNNEQLSTLREQFEQEKQMTSLIEERIARQQSEKDQIREINDALKGYADTLKTIDSLSKKSTRSDNEIGYNTQNLDNYIAKLNQIEGVTASVDSATGMLSVGFDEVGSSAVGGAQGVAQIQQTVDGLNQSIQRANAQKLDVVNEQEVQKIITLYKQLGEAQANLARTKNDRFSSSADIAQAVQAENTLREAIEAETRALEANGIRVQEDERVKKAMADASTRAAKANNEVEQSNQRTALSFANLRAKIEDAIKTTVQYSLSFQALSQLDNVVRSSITTINDLNKSMADIRIVTGETAESAQQTMAAYAELAQQLGVTTAQVAEGKFALVKSL